MQKIYPLIFSYLVFEALWSQTGIALVSFSLLAIAIVVCFWRRSGLLLFLFGFLLSLVLYVVTSIVFSGHRQSAPLYRLTADFASFSNLYSRGKCGMAKLVWEKSRDPYVGGERYIYFESGLVCELISLGPDGVRGGRLLSVQELRSYPSKFYFPPTISNLTASLRAPVHGDVMLRCFDDRCVWMTDDGR